MTTTAKVFLRSHLLLILSLGLMVLPATAQENPFGDPVPPVPHVPGTDRGSIIEISPDLLDCPNRITFDDVAGGISPGTNYDGIVESDGASFGERFAGQVLATFDGFDSLSPTAAEPLTLEVGATGENLNIFVDIVTGSQVLCGNGPVGWPDLDAVGEGSFAVLFDYDQSEFGFDLMGGSGGSATLDFFRRDGSLIDSILIPYLSMNSYAFRTIDGVREIAGIAIHNTDPGGIGFDNLCHDVPGVIGYPPVCVVTGPTHGDAGVPVQFDASASYDPDGEIVSYWWNFGVEGVSIQDTVPSPSFIYEEDGDYVITVRLTDNDGLVSECTLDPIVSTDKLNWDALKSMYR